MVQNDVSGLQSNLPVDTDRQVCGHVVEKPVGARTADDPTNKAVSPLTLPVPRILPVKEAWLEEELVRLGLPFNKAFDNRGDCDFFL